MTATSISKGVIKDIIIVVVGVIIIWIGLQLVFGTQNPFYVVSSGSMIPVLQVYDVLVVQGNEPFEEVKVGDIIVFNRPSDHDRVIVHRVASVINDDPLTIRTKGDANPASIPGTDFPITEEEYIGQVAYVIPQVGYITRILQPPINYIIIVIIIGVMVVKQFSKKKNEKAKNTSESTISENCADLTQPKHDVQNLTDLDNIPKDSEYSKEPELNLENKQNESTDTPEDKESEKKD